MGKAKIVIVEDEAIVAEFMTTVLTEAGYDVTRTVTAGEEAVEVIPRIAPDLVLMDVTLSGTIDGITACEEIRKTCEIPVVFVSAYEDNEMIGRAIRAKPSGHLAKPFNEHQLVGKVETALAWQELHSGK